MLVLTTMAEISRVGEVKGQGTARQPPMTQAVLDQYSINYAVASRESPTISFQFYQNSSLEISFLNGLYWSSVIENHSINHRNSTCSALPSNLG